MNATMMSTSVAEKNSELRWCVTDPSIEVLAINVLSRSDVCGATGKLTAPVGSD
jgi:hypothetical protein